jgi:hypothetical protein
MNLNLPYNESRIQVHSRQPCAHILTSACYVQTFLFATSAPPPVMMLS